MRPWMLTFALLLTACGDAWVPPDSAFTNRGNPESLLDVSSEIVNLNLANPQEAAQLSSKLAFDKPTRAELYCLAEDKACKDAKAALERASVPLKLMPSAKGSATLVYDRIVARDCDPRYRNHTQDKYWMNQSEWGCSIASNMVTHVSDKTQFTNPKTMGDAPATGAVNAYNNAYRIQTQQQGTQEGYTLDQSTLSQAATGN